MGTYVGSTVEPRYNNDLGTIQETYLVFRFITLLLKSVLLYISDLFQSFRLQAFKVFWKYLLQMDFDIRRMLAKF